MYINYLINATTQDTLSCMGCEVPQVYDVDLMMILDFGTSESTIYDME